MKPLTRTTVIVNTVGLIAVLAVNYLSNSLPLNGHTPAELSDLYPNYFVPAGLTFAIWGVIYTWLIVWTGYQIAALFSPALSARLEPSIEKSSPWFILSCFLNIMWLFTWHWQLLGWSVAVMITLLLTLIKLNIAIREGEPAQPLEKRLAWIPFGIYQGWITVALIANITALLVSEGILTGGSQESTIAAIMVGAGALIAVAVLFRQKNIGHGAAVVWALLGIWLKQHVLEGADHQMVAWAAVVGIVPILGLLVLNLRSK